MTKYTKIGLIVSLSGIALVLTYFLAPLKEWKEYKQNHPSLFDVQDENTPTFAHFCESYWKTFMKINTPQENDITYDGGELDEFIVYPDND